MSDIQSVDYPAIGADLKRVLDASAESVFRTALREYRHHLVMLGDYEVVARFDKAVSDMDAGRNA